MFRHFYPRPPGGGRPRHNRGEHVQVLISIHALRVEGDAGPLYHAARRVGISIHALRVEGDVRVGLLPRLRDNYFYPRPPGGGRQRLCID